MKNFLAHLRNEWFRYGLETLVVIVGVLIAIALNNWNEERKEKIEAARYLVRFQQDIEKDIELLTQRIKFSQELSHSYLEFAEQMYSSQRSTEEFIALLSSVEFNVDELYLTDITYSELVASGKLELIPNRLLKERLINYYRQYEFVASRIEELNSSNLHQINESSSLAPTLKYHLKGTGLLEGLNILYRNGDWDFINDTNSMAFRQLEETVLYYYGKQEITRPMLQELVQMAQDLVSAMEDERLGN